jgi:hypothetical protein
MTRYLAVVLTFLAIPAAVAVRLREAGFAVSTQRD